MVSNEQIILEEVNKKIQEITDRIFQLSQEKLVSDGKIDTGFLLKTANVNRRFLGATIIYPAEYADDIEFGRAVGSRPPLEPLVGWVIRKLKITPERVAINVANDIAHSIEERGIAATPFIEPSVMTVKKETETRT